MLVENTLFGTRDKVQIAIERLRQFEPQEGYYVAFSGGKDSCVVLDLVKKSGVKYDAYYNLTTVDPPELVRFIRDHYPDVIVESPKKTMWKMIEDHGFPPTRIIRYCCKELKERGGRGGIVVTGVRKAESVRRSKRQMFEPCYNDNSIRYLHPIIDYDLGNVWEYIHRFKVPYCNLYNEGFDRLGCILCPMQGSLGMKRDALKWPKYKQNYIKAFDRAIKKAIEKGRTPTQKTGLEMYEWWVSGKVSCEDKNPDQQRFFFD